MMTPETLGQSLTRRDAKPVIEGVGFSNWTEPLLHPHIAALIHQVSSRDIRCWVSSNLNVLRDPDALLAAKPHEIIVSVSGFNQAIYERGHRGGDIEIVKENMRRLSEAAARGLGRGNRTWLRLTYHRYVDNADDERLMEDYAKGLGYAFSPCWALVTGVERVLDIDLRRTTFPEDSDLLNRLALPMREAMKIVGQTPATSCGHIDGRLVLDANADVYLCCASSGSPTNILGNFLASPLADLQRAKTTHPLCGPCMQHSVTHYLTALASTTLSSPPSPMRPERRGLKTFLRLERINRLCAATGTISPIVRRHVKIRESHWPNRCRQPLRREML